MYFVEKSIWIRRIARLFGWFILKFGLERHFETALRELKDEIEKA